MHIQRNKQEIKSKMKSTAGNFRRSTDEGKRGGKENETTT